MLKNSFIHEVFTRKTFAFNPGHSCQIVLNENKIFPEKFTSHYNLNLGCKILNVIHVYVYSLQTLLPNLATEVVACENIETSKSSKFKTKFR